MSVLEIAFGASAHRPSVIARLAAMLAVARQRRALAKLDAHLLCDIGVSRGEALEEARLPAWDVPANRRG